MTILSGFMFGLAVGAGFVALGVPLVLLWWKLTGRKAARFCEWCGDEDSSCGVCGRIADRRRRGSDWL